MPIARIAAAAAAGLLLWMTPATAQDVPVPGALDDWRGWVLDGKEYLGCPLVLDQGGTAPDHYLCEWPRVLQFDAGARGATFSQEWTITGDDRWVALPGDTEHWPESVTVDGRPATVLLRDGAPAVRLEPGQHRVAGRFAWHERPGTLRVPPQSGLIALTVDGAAVARPEIERGAIFFGEQEQTVATADALDVNVYRLVADGVPTRLTTRFAIDVSGTVREASFGPVLPDGYLPLALQSPLPARLEADGRLRLQVRPGRWVVTLIARAPDVADAVTLPEARDNLPGDEVWSFLADESLRVAAPGGLPPLDPEQARVPNEWHSFPAFRVLPGESLVIEERSRGRADNDNDLKLVRELWLDFDGRGFTVVDDIGGEMRRDWRLDMQPPYRLESATEDGAPLLVTAGDGEEDAGVEVRSRYLDLGALARVDAGGRLPATGWDQRFSRATTTVYLPPGHKLLAAIGADTAAGSWTTSWQLLDFFLVLIITIAAWRLFGTAGGAVALAALVLSYQEPGAPVWLWLNLLIAAALLAVAPAGRLLTAVRLYAGASALLLVLALVPFVAQQLRIAIYPQLEPQTAAGVPDFRAGPAPAPAAPPEESQRKAARNQMLLDAPSVGESMALEEIVVSGTRVDKLSGSYARYAPNAIVQTGPGIPDWQWNRYWLSWSGPVEPTQSLRLVILPSWLVSLLRVVEVGLLLGFLAIAALHMLRRRWRLPGGLVVGRAAAGVLALALVVVPDARAAMPTPELLRDLERRLTEPADCAPRCAEISAAAVSVRGDEVSLLLAVEALEDSAVPLPGAYRGWRPSAVRIDGNEPADVRRGEDRILRVRVPAGRHAITLRGATGDADNLEIPFPVPPRRIEVDADGWSVAGLRGRQLVSGALQLTRVRQATDADAATRWEATRFPPFVAVTRTLELDLDWRVTTQVSRIAPVEGALSLRVPLLAGESVLTENLDVEDGELLVNMAPRQASVTWQSRLPRNADLRLDMPSGVAWTETWHVNAGSVWHVDFDGLPESASDAGDGVRTAVFHPRGGESLVVSASRPDAIEGGTLAFDRAALTVSQGQRSRETTLSLEYRSTRGAQHVLTLPGNAELLSVTIDGDREPLRIEDGRLAIPVLPGEHDVEITWRDPTPAGFTGRMPVVDLGAPASNVTQTIDLPPSRWLLGAAGPALGPAVLYWSELAVLVVFAWILSRIRFTPLRFHHWLLLGLGFSTFSWGVFAVVVAWLVAVGARDRWRPDTTPMLYNAQQGGVIVLTIVALLAIAVSLPLGLLGVPDMSVTGNGSWGNHLVWFADRADGVPPAAVAWSVSLWVYKVLILAWALWLSFALLRWLPWTWQCFVKDGFFRSRLEKAAP